MSSFFKPGRKISIPRARLMLTILRKKFVGRALARVIEQKCWYALERGRTRVADHYNWILNHENV